MTNRIGPMDQGSIGKLTGKVEETSVSRARDRQSPAKSPESADGKAGDTVQLTSGAQLLSKLESSLKAAPAVDSARVADVKAAIASGNYEIDSGAIADAMIRFERLLGE